MQEGGCMFIQSPWSKPQNVGCCEKVRHWWVTLSVINEGIPNCNIINYDSTTLLDALPFFAATMVIRRCSMTMKTLLLAVALMATALFPSGSLVINPVSTSTLHRIDHPTSQEKHRNEPDLFWLFWILFESPNLLQWHHSWSSSHRFNSVWH